MSTLYEQTMCDFIKILTKEYKVDKQKATEIVMQSPLQIEFDEYPEDAAQYSNEYWVAAIYLDYKARIKNERGIVNAN